jgi:hypothetical protein
MSLITASVRQQCLKSLGGISRCYIAPRVYANTFNMELTPAVRIEDQDSIIASVTDNGGAVDWYPWHVEETVSQIGEKKETGPQGTIYVQQVDMFIPQLSAAKRAILRQLISTPVVVIVLARSGKYWLAGQSFGMKSDEYSAGSSTINGRQGYQLTLISTDSEPFREVSPDFLSSVVPDPIP